MMSYLFSPIAGIMIQLKQKPAITTLSVTEKRLNAHDLQFIFDSLKTHPSIKGINFSRALLDAAGFNILCSSLNEDLNLDRLSISLSNSEAIQFANAIEYNKALKHLEISPHNEPLNDENAIAALSNALSINNTLEELIIMCDLNGVSARSLADAVANNTSLIKFKLAGGNIDRAGALALATMFERNKHLKKIELQFNAVDHLNLELVVVAYVAMGLEHNATLEELDIRKNRINSEGATIIARALQLNNKLKILNLSNNSMGSVRSDYNSAGSPYHGDGPHDEGVKDIAVALAKNTGLIKLDLSSNRVGPTGVSDIAGALLTNKTLQDLNLTEVVLDEQSSKSFGETIRINTSLRILKIGTIDASRSEVDAMHILGALSENKTLMQLDLIMLPFGNNEEDDAAAADRISSVFENNKSLRSLKLIWCNISERNMLLILDALKKNTGLRALCLTGNTIGDEASIALADVIKSNATLVELDLSRCAISANGLKNIVEALEFNRTLNTLNLSHNLLPDNEDNDDFGEQLAVALEKNHALHNVNLEANYFGPATKAKFRALAARKYNDQLLGYGLLRKSAIRAEAAKITALKKTPDVKTKKTPDVKTKDDASKKFALEVGEDPKKITIPGTAGNIIHKYLRPDQPFKFRV